ncbi:MAG: DNA-directed RNA polymerase subunit alpha [Bdellovibrionota bacterium]
MKRINLMDLITPKRVEVTNEIEDKQFGKFVAEPLERGFGITLGNALRRVMLSTLEGAAITSVKIDGISHEFSTIQGVVEDVTDIVLNLKEVVLTIDGKNEAQLSLDVQGPCDLVAGMFTGDSAVTIINPELKIATLGEGARVKIDISVKKGRGYVPAENNKIEGAPVDTIFIDSIYSPVRKVNTIITNARVGQKTDYDKLTLEVWTDGSIDPRCAVAEAAYILVEQFNLFVGENLIVEEKPEIVEAPKAKFNENLFKRIDEIELSVRSANCLENADIKYIGELVTRTESDMLRTKNFGRKSLNEVKEILAEMGLKLDMKLDGFPTREELNNMRNPVGK